MNIFKRIRKWAENAISVFRSRTKAPSAPQVIESQVPRDHADITSLNGLVEFAKIGGRIAATPVPRTLSELLDCIETTFDNLTRNSNGGSFTHKSLRAGLKKLGPHIWCDESRETASLSKIEITDKTKWPSLMFVSHPKEKRNRDQGIQCRPDFSYANKMKKLPYYVRGPATGIHYECGMAFRFGGVLFWQGFFVTVDPDTGEIHPCLQLSQHTVSLPRGGSYTKIDWSHSAFADDQSEEADKISLMRLVFAGTYFLWSARGDTWSVSVRKDGSRVTFCIPPSSTKAYFKDRERVETKTGRRRPICHFRKSHDRTVLGSVVNVRETVVGNRNFDWRGYECTVNAPSFHVTSSDFGAASEEMPPGEPARNSISMSQMARFLAAAEDGEPEAEKILRQRRQQSA